VEYATSESWAAGSGAPPEVEAAVAAAVVLAEELAGIFDELLEEHAAPASRRAVSGAANHLDLLPKLDSIDR